MAYYSGTASSLADLRTALLTHAVADGWTLTGDVLSKAGVYFQIQVGASNITCLGCESNAVANPAPNTVRIGLIFNNASQGYTQRLISFPCTYEVFGFAQELYLVVNYDVDSYQWMAFGKSTIPGLPGQGGWCAATNGSTPAGTTGNASCTAPMTISTTSGGSSAATSDNMAPALFWTTLVGNHMCSRNGFINHNLDGLGWKWNAALTYPPIGIAHKSPLQYIQPNLWNSDSVLLSVTAMVERPSFKSSLILDLENARHIRIDYLQPGDILTIGSDQWKVFPWYIKNLPARDGGGNINHSGTYGWAVRYEGP